MPEPLYLPTPFFLFRSPLWSLEDCQRLLAHSSWMDAIFDLYETDELFQEAVAIASSSLSNALKKPGYRQNQSLALSLFNYAIRMATRAIPFGLFSFAGIGTWGNAESPLDLSLVYKRARPSISWIYTLIENLPKNLSFTVKKNALVECSGERVFHSYFRKAQKGKTIPQQFFSIRATALVKAILELTRETKTIAQLSEETLSLMPRLDREKVVGVILELLDRQFLLPGLLPSLLCHSPFQDLLARLPKEFAVDDLADDIGSYNRMLPGQGAACLEALQEKMGIGSEALQVDSAYSGAIEIPKEVGEELCDAAEILWQLSPRRADTSPIRAHLAKFIDKYGTHRTVPLLHLISEKMGLGPLPSAPSTPPIKSRLARRWEDWLHHAWQTALLHHTNEIVIDQKTVQELRERSEEPPHAPSHALNSLDLFFKLYRHQKSFIISSISLTWQGAGAIGRFIDLFGDPLFSKLKSFALQEDQLENNAVSFEVSYWPLTGHNANVTIHPCFRRNRLDLMEQNERFLSLEDIYVGATSERFYLTDQKGSHELIARTANLLNPKFAPPVLYFLREVTLARQQLIYPFSWGDLEEKAFFLPRVRFQRSILSPARWNFPAATTDKLSAETFASRFNEWADRWNLPKQSLLVKDDQHLLFDRSHPAHLKEIFQMSKQGLPLYFFEQFDAPWFQSERGHHLCEWVMTCLKNPKYASNRSIDLKPHSPIPLTTRLKGIGTEWLYLKLYLPNEGVNRFLIEHLAPLGKRFIQESLIQSWFFIRYSDPQFHLRFRLLLPSTSLSAVLNAIQQITFYWIQNGLIQETSFCSYEREIERYGGIDHIETAETLFCVDSASILPLLTDSASKNYPPPLLYAYSVIHFLKSLRLNESKIIELLSRQEIPSIALKGFREHRSRLLALIEHKEISELFEQVALLRKEVKLGFDDLAIYDSLLHMHCNRLGCNAEQEKQARLYALHALLKTKLSQGEKFEI